MKKICRYIKRYPLSLLCIAAIWYLCIWFMPPKTPLNDVRFIDKWTHFVMYGGTCSVIWWEYLRCHPRVNALKLFLLAVMAPVAMSGVIELLQAYCTTNRAGEWLDFAANTTGCILSAIVGTAFLLRRKRK